MKSKKLLLLAVVAFILGALAWHTWKQEQREAVPEAVGKPAFPDLDVNMVQGIRVVSSDSTVSVARVSGKWVVPERYDYPANFSKISQIIRDLADAKIWQVMNLADTQLDGLKLLLPGNAPEGKSDAEGELVSLLGPQDSVITSFIVGKPFMRKAESAPGGAGMMISSGQDGQYVRLSDGSVVILPTFLGRLIESSEHWLADDLVNLPPSQIDELTVAGPDTPRLEINRDATTSKLELKGLAKDEETDPASFNQLTSLFNYFSFHDVANPKLTPEETGLDSPTLVTAVATQGVVYALSIGGQVSDSNPDRYVSVKLSMREPEPAQPEPGEQPESDDAQKKAEAAKATHAAIIEQLTANIAEQNKRFTSWVYIVKSYRVEPALVSRETLVRKKEEQKEDEPAPSDETLHSLAPQAEAEHPEAAPETLAEQPAPEQAEAASGQPAPEAGQSDEAEKE